MSTVMEPVTRDQRSTFLGEVASALQTADADTTDIESVVAATTVSLQAVNEAFGGMDGLVIALVDELSASMIEPLGPCATEDAFRKRLRAFAARVTDHSHKSQMKCLYRIALTNAIRNTGLGQRFYEHGPGRVSAELTRFIESARQHGVVCEEQSRSLASHFMAILRAHLDVSDVFSPTAVVNAAQAEAAIAQAVDQFCSGVLSRSSK